MDPSVPVMSIYVRDLEEAIGFYCGTLGFAVKQRYGACIATLDNAGATLLTPEPHPFPAGTMISILDTSGNQLDIVQFG